MREGQVTSPFREDEKLEKELEKELEREHEVIKSIKGEANKH